MDENPIAEPLRAILKAIRDNRNLLIKALGDHPDISEGLRRDSEQALSHFDAAVREFEAAMDVLDVPLEPPE